MTTQKHVLHFCEFAPFYYELFFRFWAPHGPIRDRNLFNGSMTDTYVSVPYFSKWEVRSESAGGWRGRSKESAYEEKRLTPSFSINVKTKNNYGILLSSLWIPRDRGVIIHSLTVVYYGTYRPGTDRQSMHVYVLACVEPWLNVGCMRSTVWCNYVSYWSYLHNTGTCS